MTLISNDPVPSSAVEFQDKSFKPESPPSNEVDKNRFKESLDKAIAEETRVSENNKETPVKDAKAEVQTKVSETEKKPVDGKKKDLNRPGKVAVVVETDVKLPTELEVGRDKKELSTERPLLNKTTTSKKTVEKSLTDNLPEALEMESEELEVNTEIKEETAQQKNPVENEAVIIPFPQNGDIEIQAALLNPEKNESTAAGALKASGKKQKNGKEEPTLTVIDTRSSEKSETIKNDFVSKTASITESVDQTGKDNNQIILGEQNADKIGIDEVKSFESRFTDNKEVLLAKELKDSGNEKIVKKASFILKDNNQGEIKLILKPESLGRVKIQLNINENNLVGKIIVENSRVGQIFENNLSNLSKSFEEAGISSSSIEVSVGDGNKESADQNKTFQNDQPYYSDQLKTLDEAVPALGRYGSEGSHQLVNLVV